jgi:hypothetical protein
MLARGVREFLKTYDAGELKQVYYTLRANGQDFSGFFTSSFLRSVSENKFKTKKDIHTQICQLLDEVTQLSDLLFFLLLVLFSRFDGRVSCVCFDNLDGIYVDYLAEVMGEAFVMPLLHGQRLANVFAEVTEKLEALDFQRNFRFLFVLRDANSATIDAHGIDSHGVAIHRIPLPIRFEDSLYEEVFLKRAELAVDTYRDAGGVGEAIAETASTLGALVRSLLTRDSFFKDVFLPLFNYDVKKLVRSLVSVLDNDSVLPRDQVLRLTGEGSPKGLELYGLRGSIFHGLISVLDDQNFVKDYRRFKFGVNREVGYCHHARVVLTALMNSVESDARLSSERPRRGEEFTDLKSLITILWGVFEPTEIINTLADLFLYHRRNWVHLVTIKNKAVLGRSAFSREAEVLEEYAGRFPRDEKPHFSARDKQILEAVKIKLNPAGHIYLKTLVTHFEFYSVVRDFTRPLFYFAHPKRWQGLKFLNTIDSVFRLTELHCGLMRDFFENVYRGVLGLSEESFRRSDLAFRKQGESDQKGPGSFHSTRLIISHMRYIDNFRRHLFDTSRDSMGEDDVRRINRELWGRLSQYMKLARDGVDSDLTLLEDSFATLEQKLKKTGFSNVSAPLFELTRNR